VISDNFSLSTRIRFSSSGYPQDTLDDTLSPLSREFFPSRPPLPLRDNCPFFLQTLFFFVPLTFPHLDILFLSRLPPLLCSWDVQYNPHIMLLVSGNNTKPDRVVAFSLYAAQADDASIRETFSISSSFPRVSPLPVCPPPVPMSQAIFVR